MIRDIEHLYRHDFGRKRGFFNSTDRPIKVPKEDAEELGIYDAKEHNIEGTFDELWENAPLVFILNVDGKPWLVNTEGYEYCRYIVPCEIVNDQQS